MRRLGIFVFYNSEGIVERYVDILLESLVGELDELIIAVNGKITDDSMQRLKKYSEKIFVRENRGYDGGAFKDVFLTYLSLGEMKKWDEIVLFNDTFYGPVFSWKPVFEKMETVETDFWGLTAHPGGEMLLGEKKTMPYHLQTYFIVCRKKMFMDDDFKLFWERLKYPSSYKEAISDYEIGFTSAMKAAGYKGISYVEVCDAGHLMEYGKNLCIEKAKELIDEIRLPILKRRLFEVPYFSLSMEVLDVLHRKSDYDISALKEDAQKTNRRGRFSGEKLQQFCNSHERIYIYGHGRYGTGVADYLTYNNIPYEGFLVSERKDTQKDVYQYGEIVLGENDGVILALNKNVAREVYLKIKEDIREEQIFLGD